MISGGKWYTSLTKGGDEMIVNIAWLVKRGDMQVLCSEPENVDTFVRTILRSSDLKITNPELYEHVWVSLDDIDSPKESYVQLDYNYASVDDCESIKITRLQLL